MASDIAENNARTVLEIASFMGLVSRSVRNCDGGLMVTISSGVGARTHVACDDDGSVTLCHEKDRTSPPRAWAVRESDDGVTEAERQAEDRADAEKAGPK